MTISATSSGSGGNGSNTTVVLSGVTVPAGAIIVVAVTEASGDALLGSVSDSAGNSYSLITSADAGGSSFYESGIFYSTTGNALSGGSLTYTKHNGVANTAISAVYVTGAKASSPLDTAVTQRATGSSSAPSVTSGTPTSQGELFIATVGWPNATLTQDSGHGWASPPAQGSSTANVAGGNQINSTAAALTFSPALGSAQSWAAFVIGFKPATRPGMFAVL